VGWDSAEAVAGTSEIRHVLAGVLRSFAGSGEFFTRILSIDPLSFD
jgi:hypothetical protein